MGSSQTKLATTYDCSSKLVSPNLWAAGADWATGQPKDSLTDFASERQDCLSTLRQRSSSSITRGGIPEHSWISFYSHRRLVPARGKLWTYYTCRFSGEVSMTMTRSMTQRPAPSSVLSFSLPTLFPHLQSPRSWDSIPKISPPYCRQSIRSLSSRRTSTILSGRSTSCSLTSSPTQPDASTRGSTSPPQITTHDF